jgi:ectoine hydroxylase-related dioxygenase (phytanoyl-CoA dioxygenase family)
MLQAVKRMLRSLLRAPAADPYRPMWIDTPGATARIAAIGDTVTRTALQDVVERGFAVLPGNIAPSACDRLIAEFDAYCAAHPEHSQFADRFGLHDRLAAFHLGSGAARALARDPAVLRIVGTALEAQPLVAGSLFFERGSAQAIHRDTPAFFTVPLNHFFGVWHALEDIHPDSGALTYYAGGHRCLPDAAFAGSGYQNMDAYFQAIRDECVRRRLPLESLLARKGDTLIWHPQLPHGGSAIADPRRSRKSIVFHYIPEHSPMWGPHEFFGPPAAVSPRPNMRRVDLGGGLRALDWGAPRFIRNLPEGNFRD